MKNFLFISALFVALLVSQAANAASYVLVGKGGEKATLESAPDQGKDAYFLKLEGTGSIWDGKVFVVQKTVVAESDRYSFSYKVELSSGAIEKTYQPLVETGGTLVNGTIVDTYKLFTPAGNGQAVELSQSPEGTATYEKGSLAQAYKQSPYTPTVE